MTAGAVANSAGRSAAQIGGTYVVGGAAAGACAATGIGTVVAAGCAAVGGTVGGCVGGKLYDDASWAADRVDTFLGGLF
ncbi:MAG: hypothetical protein KY462_04500 [Actinobacteria bacterium]|nr:hypothetical protein [Actinomycetota bacterium]